MILTLEKLIYEEAKKHIDRYHEYHNAQELEYQRSRRRINYPEPKRILTPPEWMEDRKFDPFYVLKRRKAIARSISRKLETGRYQPYEPFRKEIPKKGGVGKRQICVFQIPDAAVSNFLYKRLLSKNKHRFSSWSYAYRDDRNAHYAVQDISIELRNHPRLFVSEFDFSNFFGSVDHEYLREQLSANGFLISEFERELIDKFISINPKGIPLGTSISLFLANLVCWKLDRRLEQEGLRFARYADDTIVWSNDYAKICTSFEIIHEFSQEAGVAINQKKSSGISLLASGEMPTEIASKPYVEFVGYRLSNNSIAIKEDSVKRIKQQISYLLYRNLIQPVKSTPLRAVIIPNVDNGDPAFITAIMQIRRYMYGNLSEDKLSKYLIGAYKRLAFKGLMSYYPLINDLKQMQELDSWLFGTIMNCIALRERLLRRHGHVVAGYFPFNLSRTDFLKGCKDRHVHGRKGLVQIPSFARIFRALEKGIMEQGIYKTMNPNANMYDYDA